VSLRVSLQLVVCGLSLTGCSSPSFDSVKDPGKRWSLLQSSNACNAEIERKRWGSIAAILNYEQREPDDGYAACMANKRDQSPTDENHANREKAG